MKLRDLENKKILIVGYGKEGKATQSFLQKMVPSARLSVVDRSQGENYLANQEMFDIAIKSPGVHAADITIPYTTATNLFFATVTGFTIGVTGTKGKSTTTSLIAHILQKAGKPVHLVGNIGNPMLAELLVANSKDDIWVCELSSYQLSDIAYAPDIAVIVSLFPEHMDYHGSVAAYYAAKGRMVKEATSKQTVVYNSDFPEITQLLEETEAIRVPFIPQLPFAETVVPLVGKHNLDNVRGAVTVAQLLCIPNQTIQEAVASFTPLKHRLQNIGTYKDITFYDDAISTTPQSAIAALHAIPNSGTLLLGGQDRGYDFLPLAKELAEKNIPNIILFPESGEKIKQALKEFPQYHPQIFETTTTKDAVAWAYAHTPKNTSCVLSPASPSYSLWKNFEVRGDEFAKFVKEQGKE